MRNEWGLWANLAAKFNYAPMKKHPVLIPEGSSLRMFTSEDKKGTNEFRALAYPRTTNYLKEKYLLIYSAWADNHTFIWMSEAVVNAFGNKAMIHYSFSAGGLSGSVHQIFFEKIGTKWVVVYKVMIAQG